MENAVAIARLMRQLNLNWLGLPDNTPNVRSTFEKVAAIFSAYVILDCFLQSASTGIILYLPMDHPPSLTVIAVWWVVYSLQFLINVLFWGYMLVAIMNIRRSLRRRDGIPQKRCRGCEDFCCAFFCDCCSVAQMLRHTEHEGCDEEELLDLEEVSCCSKEQPFPLTRPLIV
jgi:Cys-rich protein (TIGR01571 family)